MDLSALATLDGGFYFPDLLPGATLEARLDGYAALGFDAVEIWGRGLPGNAERVRKAAKASGLAVSAVCSGFRGCLLAADPEARKQAFEDIPTLLEAAALLEASGLVVAPYQAHIPAVPGLEPHKSAEDVHWELLYDLLGRLGERAASLGTKLLIEPVNRYETHLIRRVGQAVEFCDRVGGRGLGVVADTFHMNIEETDPAEVFARYGARIDHVHCVDSNRCLPGQGHSDFAAWIPALRGAGYRGALSFECFVHGEPREALSRCLKFLRGL